MKRFSLWAIWILVLLGNIPAQAAMELSGFGGYQFGGRIPTTAGEVDFQDNLSYGLSIEFALPVKPGTGLILWYSRQDSEARLESAFGKRKLTDATINYFQGGVVYNVDQGRELVPFTLVMLGATWVDPSSPGTDGNLYEGFTKFSFAFGGGIKYWASPKVAIRLQFNLFMTMLNSGAYFGVGTGGGSFGISGSGFAQGLVMGGVTIGFGD